MSLRCLDTKSIMIITEFWTLGCVRPVSMPCWLCSRHHAMKALNSFRCAFISCVATSANGLKACSCLWASCVLAKKTKSLDANYSHNRRRHLRYLLDIVKGLGQVYLIEEFRKLQASRLLILQLQLLHSKIWSIPLYACAHSQCAQHRHHAMKALKSLKCAFISCVATSANCQVK